MSLVGKQPFDTLSGVASKDYIGADVKSWEQLPYMKSPAKLPRTFLKYVRHGKHSSIL
jgi:hypothetical protein